VEVVDSFIMVYVKYTSLSLSTYVGLSKPLARGSTSISPLNVDTSTPNFPDGQDQYVTTGVLRVLSCNTPSVSILRDYEPGLGSIRLFFEMS
jgi:hypothetical protein